MSKYEINENDQFIALLDVSASMNETEKSLGGLTRIKGGLESFGSLIKEASKFDKDGVDFVTFGQEVKHLGAITADQVDSVLGKIRATEGMTNTHLAIKKAWELHQAKGSTENTIVFVATDGAPSDRSALTAQLKSIAAQQKAGDERFSVSFLIVPNLAEAPADLQAYITELDDVPMKDADGNDIDFIDKQDLAGITFVAAAAGAIND